MEKIGVCDWGIGGIGVMQHLRQLAHYEIVYLSDAGFTPYGKVNEQDLYARWEKVKAFFLSQGVTKIAVACNALSTVVAKDKNFITVIESGVALVLETDYKNVGVTGGHRTVESKSYYNSLIANGYKVIQSIGQVLSAKVEAGDLNSIESITAIQTVFAPLASCEAVLLACTHYPVLSNEINKAFPKLVLLDPARNMAQKISEEWSQNGVESKIVWNTTGSIEVMKESALICFNEKIEKASKVVL